MNSRSVIYKCFISHDRFALFCFVSLRNRIASHRIESHRLVSIRSASHLFASYRIVLICIALHSFTLHRFALFRIALFTVCFPRSLFSVSFCISFCFCSFLFFLRHCAMPRILCFALASSWLHIQAQVCLSFWLKVDYGTLA